MGILNYDRITRGPGPVVLEGIRVPTLDALCAAIDGVDSCIATDLSLGAWRGCQVATELETQMGLPSETRCGVEPSVSASQGSLPPYADFVGESIDAESSGDRTTLDALKRASHLASVLRARPPRSCLVLVPRYGLPWEKHDALVIRFLAEALRESSCRLILVSGCEEGPVLPRGWTVRWRSVSSAEQDPPPGRLLALVPSIVSPEVATAVQAADPNGGVARLSLAGGNSLIGPEFRRPPARVSRLEYDRLAVATQSLGWLAAYAQFFGNNFYIDPYFLCEQARQRLAEGGYEIALRLLERASVCSRYPELSAICQSYAQGMRIVLQRFQEAAGAPEPPRSAPPTVRGFLLQCKGWGLVMSDDQTRAESYLREARDLLAPNRQAREYLYLLNISALNALKLGDLDRALAIEHSVEASLSNQIPRDWHLWYVNSINIARLHFRRGDTEAALLYYGRAFETTKGSRSDSDGIYANVCLARVRAKKASAAKALLEWIRAGLLWVSSSAPEALAPRVTRGILGRSLDPGESLVEQVSAALTKELLVASDAAGIPLMNTPADALPVFVRSGDVAEPVPPGAILYGAGAPGCSVLVSECETPSAFSGPDYDHLRSVLRTLLQQLVPLNDLDDFNTLAIDDRLGCEIPSTASELVGTCLRLGVPQMRFGFETVEFDEERRRLLEMALFVRLGSAVDRMEFADGKAVVTFKRYLVPRVIIGDDVAILTAIADRPLLIELARRLDRPAATVLASLRALEQSRVVDMDLDDYKYTLDRRSGAPQFCNGLTDSPADEQRT
jgi:tetratricopeptide (TPR) repeat protein